MDNIFRDTTEDIKNLVAGNFSQVVTDSTKAIDKVLDRNNNEDNREQNKIQDKNTGA